MLSSIPLRNLSPELYQIYYLFAFSSVGGQIVPFLRQLGLNCTEPKRNPAHGTVSTLIFFENVYLELFWSEETSHLAQSDMATEFHFLARVNCLETGASPFGFGLSYSTTNNDNFFPATAEAIRTDEAPISEQLLQLFPSNLANPEEPICFVVPDYVAIQNRLNRVLAISSRWHCVVCESRRYAIAEQIMHPNLGMRKLTHVKLRVFSEHILTPPLVDLCAQNILEIEYGKHPLLELTFDDGNQKRFVDLRPLIPIVLRS